MLRFDRKMRMPYGFTLLEMLVVLVIMGLLLSVVGGGVTGSLGRAERIYELDLIRQNISFVGRVASYRGEHLVFERLPVIDPKGYAAIELPPGWSVEFLPALQIGVSGACSESNVLARYQGQGSLSARFRVMPITCDVLQDAQL